MTAPAPVLSLTRVPSSSDLHHWADFAELLCLVNVDGVLGEQDLAERLRELGELQADPGPDDPDGDLEPDDDTVPPEDVTPAAVSDALAGKARDVFRHLEYRAGRFGVAYPLVVGETVVKRKARLNLAPQRLYVFLLLAASLRYVRKTDRAKLTRGMERLATELMRHWMPTHAEVHGFGTAAEGGSRYRGPLFQKLQKLAGDLRETVTAKEEDILAGDMGDAGLDTIAWLTMGDDPNPGYPLFMVQVTCIEQWRSKQSEVGPDRWSGYMTTQALPVRILCIPACPRSPTGFWQRKLWVEKTVLMDRLRIMRVLSRPELPKLALPEELLTEALRFREAVV